MKNKKFYFGAVAVLILVILVIVLPKGEKAKVPVDIILSPHYDDVVLSLGGLIAKGENKTIVATFFTGAPETAIGTIWDKRGGFKDSSEAIKARTEENKNALKDSGASVYDYGYLDRQYRSPKDDIDEITQNISKDIQTLVASYADGNTPVRVFGPAYFGDTITHPDHKILHIAYENMIGMYPKPNVDFYFYEDFPYVLRFNKTATTSVQNYVENETGFLLDLQSVNLSDSLLSKKINMFQSYISQVKAMSTKGKNIVSDLQDFFSKRCSGTPCEVVYKVFIVKP